MLNNSMKKNRTELRKKVKIKGKDSLFRMNRICVQFLVHSVEFCKFHKKF